MDVYVQVSIRHSVVMRVMAFDTKAWTYLSIQMHAFERIRITRAGLGPNDDHRVGKLIDVPPIYHREGTSRLQLEKRTERAGHVDARGKA